MHDAVVKRALWCTCLRSGVCKRARERTRKTAVPDCFEGGEGVGGREVAPSSGNAGVGAGAHLPLEDRHRRCAAARRAAPGVSAAPRCRRRSAARCVQPLVKPPPAPCRRPPSPAPGITHAHPPTRFPHAHTLPSAASPRTPCPRASRTGGRTRRSPQPPTPTPPPPRARARPRAGRIRPRAVFPERRHARARPCPRSFLRSSAAPLKYKPYTLNTEPKRLCLPCPRGKR